MSIFAVGDIHGHLDQLEGLLDMLPIEENDEIVFIGDYVDRGPDSYGVIDRLIQLKRELSCTFLMGNHDSMFLDFINGCKVYKPGVWASSRNGGLSCLLSYGLPDAEPGGVSIPDVHRIFLEDLKLDHVTGDFIFVHAGLKPGVPVAQNKSIDKLWIRDEFISCIDKWKEGRVIFGHTWHTYPLIHKNKIGIDTGCAYGGPLTAVRLPDIEFFHSEWKDTDYSWTIQSIQYYPDKLNADYIRDMLTLRKHDLQKQLQQIHIQLRIEIDAGHTDSAELIRFDIMDISMSLNNLPRPESLQRILEVRDPKTGITDILVLVRSGSGGSLDETNITFITKNAPAFRVLVECGLGDLPAIGEVISIDDL